jgi:hypothetical protein
MFIKIGDIEFKKNSNVDWVVTLYGSSSIGIRAHIQTPEAIKVGEEKLYKLREGRTEVIEILTEEGSTVKGQYKVNELNWKKEIKPNGESQLLFNIGLQR